MSGTVVEVEKETAEMHTTSPHRSDWKKVLAVGRNARSLSLGVEQVACTCSVDTLMVVCCCLFFKYLLS